MNNTKPRKRSSYVRAAIELARQQYAASSSEDVEIDDNAKLSQADEGVWVAAWVWIRADELEEFIDAKRTTP